MNIRLQIIYFISRRFAYNCGIIRINNVIKNFFVIDLDSIWKHQNIIGFNDGICGGDMSTYEID